MNTKEILEQIIKLANEAIIENLKTENKSAQARSRKLIKEIISLSKEYRVLSLGKNK